MASRWISSGTAAKSCCWHSASAIAARSARSRSPRSRARAGNWEPQRTTVQVVYVTVDPERDDAAQMRKFLGSFDPTFVGGVGTRAQIDAAQKELRNFLDARPCTQTASYTIGHSSSIYMIDRAGQTARRHALRTSAPTISCMTCKSCCVQHDATCTDRLGRSPALALLGARLWVGVRAHSRGVARRAVRNSEGHVMRAAWRATRWTSCRRASR